MIRMRVLGTVLAVVFVMAVTALATDVTMKLSGPGAVDETTIKAGEPVSVDIYFANDKDGGRGFTTGFCLKSEDIKTVIHVEDTTGLNKTGDLKGHNGWEGTAVWNFAGIWTPSPNWDGTLPDTIGFAGAVIGKPYGKHENKKVLSMNLIVPEPGTLVVDSCFVRPGSTWSIIHVDSEGVRSESKPTWGGPYKFKVVK